MVRGYYYLFVTFSTHPFLSPSGLMGRIAGSDRVTRMRRYSAEIYQELAEELDMSTGYVRRRSTRAAPRGLLHGGRSTGVAPRGAFHVVLLLYSGGSTVGSQIFFKKIY